MRGVEHLRPGLSAIEADFGEDIEEAADEVVPADRLHGRFALGGKGGTLADHDRS